MLLLGLLSPIMAIDAGSVATFLGNPIPVLIAPGAGLSFDRFLVCATPIATNGHSSVSTH